MILVYIFDIRLLVTLLRAAMLIGLLEYALVALNLLLEVLLEGGHPILDVHLCYDGGGRGIVPFHAHGGHRVSSDMIFLVGLRAPTGVLSLRDVLFRHVLILVGDFITGGTARTGRLLVDRAWRSYEGSRLCLGDLMWVLRVVS